MAGRLQRRQELNDGMVISMSRVPCRGALFLYSSVFFLQRLTVESQLFFQLAQVFR